MSDTKYLIIPVEQDAFKHLLPFMDILKRNEGLVTLEWDIDQFEIATRALIDATLKRKIRDIADEHESTYRT